MNRPISVNHFSVLLKIGFAFALMITFGLGDASAQILPDPTDLQIGGNVPPPGSDPNLIGKTGVVNIFDNSGSAGPFTEFLLILGIPEVNGNSNDNFFKGTNPIQSITAYNQQSAGPPPIYSQISGTWGSTLGGNNPYGTIEPGSLGEWNSSSGYVTGYNNNANGGTMVSGSPDAYSLIFSSKANLDNSNSFNNWSGAVQTNENFTPTGFDLYVIQIYSKDGTTDILNPKGYVSVALNANDLLNGTFAIAFAQDSKNSYDTAFTNAGLMTNNSNQPGPLPGGEVITPAPSSAILFSLGSLALLGFMAQSRRRLLAAA